MKASKFVEVLRKVIREEVRSVVKEELKALKPVIAETKKQVPIKKQAPPKRTTPLVTIDGVIGDLLRETATSLQNQNIEDEWPDMNGGPLSSQMFAADINEDGFAQPQQRDPGTYERMNGDPTSMFIKDYSKVMKAANDHAQNYRGM